MKDLKGKISVIMPAFNESDIIERNVSETIRTFENFKVDFEIIIIDDGSTDETWAKIKELEKNSPNVKVTRNMKNFGKGRALKKGFRFADGGYVVFLDSDIDLHPAQLETFFDIMNIYGRDNLWSYRYNGDGTKEKILQWQVFPVGGITIEF